MRMLSLILMILWPLLQCKAQNYTKNAETIVFSANTDGDFDVYIHDINTGLSQKIIDEESDEIGAKWSPNGEHIIFTTNKSGINQISLFSFRTGGVVNLSRNNYNELDPMISPDGKKIAFSSKETGTYQLYVMDIDGRNRKKITQSGNFNGRPDWSPDGQKLVYLSDEPGTFELFKVNVDGSNKKQLTNLVTGVGAPAWSKNGYHILFHGHVGDVDQLFSISPDGKGLKQITESKESSFSVRINSKNNKVSFIRVNEGNRALYVADIDENLELSNIKLLTKDGSKFQAGDWPIFISKKKRVSLNPRIPKEYKIVFTSYRGGTADIHLMNPDGSEITRITDSDDANSFARDYGDGKSIIYRKAPSESGSKAEFFIRDLKTSSESKLENISITEGAVDIYKSPDKKYMSYGKNVDDHRELFIYDVIKKNHIQISDNKGEENPASFYRTWWSPDSKKVAFVSGKDYYNLHLKVYDLTKRKFTKLTREAFMYAGLVWLSDSNSLIINIAKRGEMSYELFHISAGDSGDNFYFFNQLTNNPGRGNLHPSISPDGNWIAFESGREGDDGDIFLMRPDGSNQIRITNNPSYDGRPEWVNLTNNE